MSKLVTLLPIWPDRTRSIKSNIGATITYDHYSQQDHHRDPNDSCESFAPQEMLNNPFRAIYTTLIAVTAFVTLLLNLFVIITLMLDDQSSEKKHNQIEANKSNDGTNHNNGDGNGSNGLSNALDRGTRDPLIKNKSNDEQQQQQQQQKLQPPTPRWRRRYSNTHLSFISLSISVIIYSSICVPGMYLQTIDDHNKRNFFIQLLIFGFYVSPIASSFMHLLMAFDRYLAIKSCFNFRRYWYQRHYLLCIVMLWIASVLIIVPFIWYKRYSEQIQLTITLIRLLFTFTIPSFLTLAIYLSLAYELANLNQNELRTNLIQNKNTIVKHRKIIVKIVILAFTHFLCWFPFSVVESLNDLFPDLFHRCSSDVHMPLYYRFLAFLILITSMSGIAYPILYCFVSHEFRKIFKRHLFSFFDRCGIGASICGSCPDNSSEQDELSLSTQKTEFSTSLALSNSFNSQRQMESQV